MAPNLYVLLHTLVSPSQWLPTKHHRSEEDSRRSSVIVPGQPLARTEHWNSPVPGVYRHRPGVGWYLIQLDSDPSKPDRPEKVIYCEPLRRGIVESEYNSRCVKARMPKGYTPATSRSASPNRKVPKPTPPASRRASREGQPRPEVNFLRHDDGVSWINDKDANGKPTKGPWQRFFRDKDTGEMRVMLKGDDPAFKKTAQTQSLSATDGESALVASKIKAIAPELDSQRAFLGPRSLASSSRTSPRSSSDLSRPTSIRMPSSTSVRKSTLGSPALPLRG